jgi:hypothetical protein
MLVIDRCAGLEDCRWFPPSVRYISVVQCGPTVVPEGLAWSLWYSRLQFCRINSCGHVREVDVTGCPELIRLDCSSNPHLETIDASTCGDLAVVAALDCGRLEDIYLAENGCRVFLYGATPAAAQVHGPHAIGQGRAPAWPEWNPGDMLCDLMW